MIRRTPVGGLAARIGSLALLVAAVAVVVIGVGVLVVAQSTFSRLMVEHGSTAAQAHSMFDESVVVVFVVAAAIAAGVSILLAVWLSTRLAQPLREIGQAAKRIASGDYHTRVPRRGANELASLADSFNQMAQSLEDQERLRRDFIVNAAHELRTPLTNLQGYLEALRDGVIAPTPEQFRSLHEEADRLVRLSHALDSLAESQPLWPSATRQRIDLVPTIQSAIDMARPAFETKTIRVEMRLPHELVARGDPDHVTEVLGNLLQNASSYTPSGGLVTVTAEREPAAAVVAITNTGEGIPSPDLPHVFERFYRVEKSRDRSRGGAGIGLAIVKQLVEAAGGRVGAESHSGLTRFWFTLPA